MLALKGLLIMLVYHFFCKMSIVRREGIWGRGRRCSTVEKGGQGKIEERLRVLFHSVEKGGRKCGKNKNKNCNNSPSPLSSLSPLSSHSQLSSLPCFDHTFRSSSACFGPNLGRPLCPAFEVRVYFRGKMDGWAAVCVRSAGPW